MAAYIRKLKDNSNNVILPVTRAEAVYVGDLKSSEYISVAIPADATTLGKWTESTDNGVKVYKQTFTATNMKESYQIWDAHAELTATSNTNTKIQEAAALIAFITPKNNQVEISCHDDKPRVAFTLRIGVKANTSGASAVKPLALGLGSGTAAKLRYPHSITTNLASTSSAATFDGSANYTGGVTGILGTANGGTGNANGNAPTATKLATSRGLQVALATTTAQNFDGSGDAKSIGVSGILAIANGGTGASSGSAALEKLGLKFSLSGTTLTITKS